MKVTMPPLPWEGAMVRPQGHPEVIPVPPHVKKLIRHTFEEKVDKADLNYMARAILQMSDEIFEMRERMKALELAVITLRGDK